PIRLVVPLAAGGAADTIGRLFAAPLSAALGQQFVVENRPGAGGILATEAVARSEPAGYTLMVSGMTCLVLEPAMTRNVNFDPMRDFTDIAYFGGTPAVLVVHPSLGVTNLKEFSAWAALDRGKGIDYVSGGFGSVGSMVAEYFATEAGFQLRHVPYKG